MRPLQRLLKTQNPKIGDIETSIDASVIRTLHDSGVFDTLCAEDGVK